MDAPIFAYTEKEKALLSSRDPALAEVVTLCGDLVEPMDRALFASLIRNIVGQQISIPVYERIWASITGIFGVDPSPEAVIGAGAGLLRSLGVTSRKAEYIIGIADGFLDGSIDEDAIRSMDDAEAFRTLDSTRGVGPWTAEMSMMFCLGRRDVFSRGDLALMRGIRMIHGVPRVDDAIFERLRRLYSPYGTVASFYIWEVGEGRLPGYTDPARSVRPARYYQPS